MVELIRVEWQQCCEGQGVGQSEGGYTKNFLGTFRNVTSLYNYYTE